MKKQLLKKLSALIVTAMMFSASVNAQIVYTDVNPDVTINTNGGVYALDLNNDGITDFNITYTTSIFAGQTNRYIRITPLGANKVGNDLSYPNPSALPLNTLIASYSFNWLSNANQSLIIKISNGSGLWQFRGNWNGASNKYIPLQLNLNSQKFYGWARLDVSGGAVSFTVKDYAYNTTPDQPIRAGETTCALPTVNVSASGATTFCYGSPLTLTADSASGYTFQWQKNTVAISGATARTYKVTTSGNYTVTTTNTCGTATSTPISCTSIFNQTPVISTSDSLAYCAGQAINTKFNANTYTGVTYQWQKNSVNINGAIAPNFTATTTGNYRVRETANGCTRNSSAKSIVINCRIGEDISNESILSVYPNPANNYITVQFPSDQSAIISITNLFGQLVYSEKVLPITSETAQKQIDVSRFAAGMYLIRWSNEENFETKTFSVIK